jgi:hypothetical protein
VAPLSRSPFSDSACSPTAESSEAGAGTGVGAGAAPADGVEAAGGVGGAGNVGADGEADAAGVPHCPWNPPTGMLGTAVGDAASADVTSGRACSPCGAEDVCGVEGACGC